MVHVSTRHVRRRLTSVIMRKVRDKKYSLGTMTRPRDEIPVSKDSPLAIVRRIHENTLAIDTLMELRHAPPSFGLRSIHSAATCHLRAPEPVARGKSG